MSSPQAHTRGAPTILNRRWYATKLPYPERAETSSPKSRRGRLSYDGLRLRASKSRAQYWEGYNISQQLSTTSCRCWLINWRRLAAVILACWVSSLCKFLSADCAVTSASSFPVILEWLGTYLAVIPVCFESNEAVELHSSLMRLRIIMWLSRPVRSPKTGLFSMSHSPVGDALWQLQCRINSRQSPSYFDVEHFTSMTFTSPYGGCWSVSPIIAPQQASMLLRYPVRLCTTFFGRSTVHPSFAGFDCCLLSW